jgi:hypothetical protein
MSSFRVLLIRTALAIVIALIVMRLFFPGSGVWKIVGLAAVLLGLAYIFQYTRNRDRDQK